VFQQEQTNNPQTINKQQTTNKLETKQENINFDVALDDRIITERQGGVKDVARGGRRGG
jgi:hypothetical protein